MKIKEIQNSIKKIYQARTDLAIMMWGAAGIGKSAIIKELAEKLQIGFIDLRLSLLNPIDLRGLPKISGDKAQWLAPEFLPTEGKGILFLDEINLAPQAVLSAAYQLILDRKLGEYVLPDGWFIIAAGNRTEDNAAITKFPPPLANRFIHFEVDIPTIEEWRIWAIQNNIAEEIVAFLSKFPQHLYKHPSITAKSWQSPRSWEFASKLYKIKEDIGMAVGAVSHEFYAFLENYKKLPDIEAILSGKETKIPEEIDLLWAISTAIAFRAEPKHIENIFNYIAKLPKEFEMLMIVLLRDKNEEMNSALRKSASWAAWMEKNKNYLQ